MPAYESSMGNLAKAATMGRSPRPWRGNEEAHLIQRFVFHWLLYPSDRKPSGRAWARALGISHTWLQKLVRRFQTDPHDMERELRQRGEPTFAKLSRARERTNQLRERGELRWRTSANHLDPADDAKLIASLSAENMDLEYKQAIWRAEHDEQSDRASLHVFECDY